MVHHRDRAPAEVPISPITPTCQNRAHNAAGVFWLRAPDGEIVPGGTYCGPCSAKAIEDFATHLGEDWTVEPVVYPCRHSMDPRRCPECAGKKQEMRVRFLRCEVDDPPPGGRGRVPDPRGRRSYTLFWVDGDQTRSQCFFGVPPADVPTVATP